MSSDDIFARHPELLTFLDVKDESGVPVGYDFEKCWTRLNPGSVIEERDVAAGILQYYGNVSRIAKALGMNRRKLALHIARSPDLSELLEEVEDMFLDTVEHSLKMSAMTGDTTAARFFLTTKGKDRGYATRTETTGKNGGAVEENVTIDVSKLKEVSIQSLADLLSAARQSIQSD